MIQLKELSILPAERILRLCQDTNQIFLFQALQAGNNRQTTDEFGNNTEFQQIVGLNLRKESAYILFVLVLQLGAKAQAGVVYTAFDDLIQAIKGAAANKRMLEVSIWIKSCWGCFLPPCGGTFATVPSRIFSNAC